MDDDRRAMEPQGDAGLEGTLLEFLRTRTVYAFPGIISGRWGIPMLSALAFGTSVEETYGGAVFVFCTTGGKQLKFLLWEDGGFWLVTRSIQQGTFAWPDADDGNPMVETVMENIRSVLASPGRKRGGMIGLTFRRK